MRSRRLVKKLLKKSEIFDVLSECWLVKTKMRGILYVTRKEVFEAGICVYTLFESMGIPLEMMGT